MNSFDSFVVSTYSFCLRVRCMLDSWWCNSGRGRKKGPRGAMQGRTQAPTHYRGSELLQSTPVVDLHSEQSSRPYSCLLLVSPAKALTSFSSGMRCSQMAPSTAILGNLELDQGAEGGGGTVTPPPPSGSPSSRSAGHKWLRRSIV